MPRFEPYRPTLKQRDPPFTDILIREAMAPDITALAALEAAYDGGDPDDRVARLEQLMATSETGKGLILTAQLASTPVAIAKAVRFAPPPESPPNVAPAGWYL